MSKCTFIIPYYGNFPNYFQLFLNSCKYNSDFEWLIFTDNNKSYDWPANVHVHYETFKDMQERVHSAFPFHPELKTPYKLCDLKPMYGYLFSEYLKEATLLTDSQYEGKQCKVHAASTGQASFSRGTSVRTYIHI